MKGSALTISERWPRLLYGWVSLLREECIFGGFLPTLSAIARRICLWPLASPLGDFTIGRSRPLLDRWNPLDTGIGEAPPPLCAVDDQEGIEISLRDDGKTTRVSPYEFACEFAALRIKQKDLDFVSFQDRGV